MGRYDDLDTQAPAAEAPATPNKPMRAGQVNLNWDVLTFLQETIATLVGDEHDGAIWNDAVAAKMPKRILDELEKAGWIRYQDQYGDHAYVTTKYEASNPPQDTDELRINVVLTKGKLVFDIRPWGQYEERGNGGYRGRR